MYVATAVSKYSNRSTRDGRVCFSTLAVQMLEAGVAM